MDSILCKPICFIAIRGVQALFGLIVLIMAACFIHDASTSEVVWALICGFLTIKVAIVNIVVSRITRLQAVKPVTLALLAIDAVFVVFWLSSMAANARLLSLLNVPVSCQATVSNGEAVNSKYCLTKRTNYRLVVGPSGRGIIGAIIAFSVFELLLFVAAALLSAMRLRHEQASNATAPQTKEVEQSTPSIWQQHQMNTVYESHSQTSLPYKEQPQNQSQHYDTPRQSSFTEQMAEMPAYNNYHDQWHHQQQQEYQQQQHLQEYQQQSQPQHQQVHNPHYLDPYQSSLVSQHQPSQFPHRTVSPVYDVAPSITSSDQRHSIFYQSTLR